MGLENIGGWELVVLILIGLFIFGPDRLPKAISDGVRMLRNLRQMARNATGDLSRELGTNIELEDLHPKTFLRKHLLSEADEAALRKPLEDVYGELRGVRDSLDLKSDPNGDLKSDPNGAARVSDAPATTGKRPLAASYDSDAT
jgi:sec-independent protein translocase protein TatB